MEKSIKYARLVRNLLESIAADWSRNPQDLVLAVCDSAANHFLLVVHGWSERGHRHEVPIHVDILDGKIWIQENRTELELDDELIALGVPATDIVLGVVAPEYRQYSAFAVV